MLQIFQVHAVENIEAAINKCVQVLCPLWHVPPCGGCQNGGSPSHHRFHQVEAGDLVVFPDGMTCATWPFNAVNP